MALCRWTLVRERWPAHDTRRAVDGLALVPDGAVLPHFDTFGQRWIPSAQAAVGAAAPLVGVDERTAAVWRDGAWTVHGVGAVTVITGAKREVAANGSAVAGIPQPVDT
jgi:cyanophycinase-like exopeptidase